MITTTLSKDVLLKYPNPYFLETGTADADCVRLALELNFEKVFSIELDPILQNKNIENYQSYINDGRLELVTGDSLWELSQLIPKLDKPTTFWLDAHVDFGPSGTKRCPLYEELSTISFSDIKTHTILIDDMRMLGGWWGEGISVEGLTERLLKINPDYKFVYEDGFVSKDILVAYV